VQRLMLDLRTFVASPNRGGPTAQTRPKRRRTLPRPRCRYGSGGTSIRRFMLVDDARTHHPWRPRSPDPPRQRHLRRADRRPAHPPIPPPTRPRIRDANLTYPLTHRSGRYGWPAGSTGKPPALASTPGANTLVLLRRRLHLQPVRPPTVTEYPAHEFDTANIVARSSDAARAGARHAYPSRAVACRTRSWRPCETPEPRNRIGAAPLGPNPQPCRAAPTQ